jgi:hypothetical protein
MEYLLVSIIAGLLMAVAYPDKGLGPSEVWHDNAAYWDMF